jgi:hypothetical protein
MAQRIAHHFFKSRKQLRIISYEENLLPFGTFKSLLDTLIDESQVTRIVCLFGINCIIIERGKLT